MTKPKDMNVIHDPRTYRIRCEAREIEVVEEALTKFALDVYDLANQHGIADVMLVMQANVFLRGDLISNEPQREQMVSQCLHFGNEAHAVELAAYANAFFRAQLEQRLGFIKTHAEKRARP